MKLSKKTLFIILTLTAISLCVGGVIHYFHSSILTKVRYENIRGIAVALKVYENDYKTLPPLDKWCDELIEKADCGPRQFLGFIDREEGVCGYALNENLKGLKPSELEDKVVLVFEAKGPWNLSGGPELMKQSKQKTIAVLFVDGYMDFVKIEEIDTLKWKP